MVSWINKYRLYNQQLSLNKKFNTPQKALEWLCGIQAQDFPAAKYALAIRVPGISEQDIDNALEKREIIRTWPMRGTLHLISANDIHWVFDLIAPVIKKNSRWRNQQLGLDYKLLGKCNQILSDVLQGRNQLTREEITIALAESGIKVDGIQLYHILNNAAIDKLICFGTMRGKKFTFTLLDEWVPVSNPVSREEMLAELAGRYFNSRGPATLDDFKWWSGLPVTEARSALKSISSEFIEKKVNGNSYWYQKTSDKIKIKKTLLIPAFDEYLISYKDRTSMLDPVYKDRAIFINGVFNPAIVIDGMILGMWKRSIIKDKIYLYPDPFIKLTNDQKRIIEKEALGYGRFHNKEVRVEW